MQGARELSRGYFYLAGSVLLAVSLALRIASYPVVTSDYTYFLSKWFEILQNHPGLTAFASPFSDYTPLYLYAIKLLTFIPAPSLYSIKTLSCLFDAAIALVSFAILARTTEYSKAKLFFVSALVFSIPTVVINSSLWGQSDSIYAAGVLLCLYCILIDRPLPAVVSFSLSLCVKVQSVFFFPILLGYCLRTEKTAKYLLFIPCAFFLSIIPAHLGGGSLTDLLFVYAKESGEYTSLSVSAQSAFALLGGLTLTAPLEHGLFLAGIVGATVCAGSVAVVVYANKALSARGIVFLSLLCVLILPYLLPRMHERYFYLADLLSVLYALYAPRQWFLPVLVVGASLLSYMPYLSQLPPLSGTHVDLRIPSLMMLLALMALFAQSYSVVVTADEEVS